MDRNLPEKASAQGVRLLCFPECFLQGYLVEEAQARRHALDLKSPAFAAVLRRLVSVELTVVFGLIEVDGSALFNTAVVVGHGCLLGAYRKTHLLEGERIFQPGHSYPVFEAAGLRFGINICYDMNFPEAAASLAAKGAQLIMCPANNMMGREKAEQWKDVHNAVRASVRGDRALARISRLSPALATIESHSVRLPSSTLTARFSRKYHCLK